MVPKSEYIFVEHVGNVITDKLFKKYHSESDVEKFNKWMTGQTCCVLLSGEIGIYSWDYERWLRQGRKTEQGSDWD